MSKVYGLQGVLTGKLGATVFAVRNGVQLARQYQPIVMDAKTESQVAQRAKLKLLSQTAAAISSVIAIPRKGLQSARNRFIKQNFEYVGYANSEASIELADILLTASYKGLPGFTADRSSGTGISVALEEDASTSWEKVVYVVLQRTSSNSIMPVASVVCEEAGVNGTFPTTLPMVSGDISVHAYGIKLNTVASRVMYSNLAVPSAEAIAHIIASRAYVEGDMSLSETRGLYMAAADTQGQTAGVALLTLTTRVYDSTNGAYGAGGSVQGSGRFEMGATVALNAVAAEGYHFVKWADGTYDGNTLGTSTMLNVTITGSQTVVAVFAADTSNVTITAVKSSASTGNGSVTGGGTFAEGSSVTLTATPNGSSTFVGWFTQNGTTDQQYKYRDTQSITVTADADTTYYAVFADNGGGGMDG